MKRNKVYILFIITLSLFYSCKKEKKIDQSFKIEIVDSLYTINNSYAVDDVRRYGVFPSKSIGQHPILLKDKMQVLLNVAESGIKLNFPPGVYKRSLSIEGRNYIEIIFNDVTFTGAVNIKNSKKITLKGSLLSLVQLYIKESEDINLDHIVIKSDTLLSGNKKRSMGCSVHTGSNNIKINKLVVEDLISGSNEKYVKAGLAIHGHNNEPSNVSIDSVIILSSDRHGVYLTGDNILINYLDINTFGIGSAIGMEPMEGGVQGEQGKFAGLWVKNAHNSGIKKAIINIENSKGAYSVNFDIGESFRPFKIDTLLIEGNNLSLKKRILKRTGVNVRTLLNK